MINVKFQILIDYGNCIFTIVYLQLKTINVINNLYAIAYSSNIAGILIECHHLLFGLFNNISRVICFVRFTGIILLGVSDPLLLLVIQSRGILRFLPPLLLVVLLGCFTGGLVTGVVNPESIVLSIPLLLIVSLSLLTIMSVVWSSLLMVTVPSSIVVDW